jgi:hypothetical protein
LGLTLTTSKFAWHYGAVASCTAVLVAAGFSALVELPRDARLLRAIGAVLVALVGSFALSAAGRWNGYDLVSTGWRELPQVGDLDMSRPVVWLGVIGLVACVLVAVRRLRGRPADITRPLLGASLLAVCVLPTVLTWSLLVRDARSADAWSFAAQMVHSVTGGDECGLAEHLRVVTSATELPRVDRGDAQPTAALDIGREPASRVGPPAGELDVWRNEPNDDRAAGSATRGSFTTPWYRPADGEKTVLWSRGDPSQLVVETAHDDGTTSSEVLSGAAGTSYWTLHTIPPIADAEAMRVVLPDSSSAEPLAVTAPARTSSRPLVDALTDADRAYVAPPYYLYAPCWRQPSIRDGYVQPFRVSIVSEPNRGTFDQLPSEATITQIGCLDITTPWFYYGSELSETDRPCAYSVEMSDAGELLAAANE